MARLIGPDEASREVKAIVGRTFQAKVGRPAQLWADEGATIPADVLDLDGAPIPAQEPAGNGGRGLAPTVTIDSSSMLPLVQYPPNDVDVIYGTCDGGPSWPIYARTDDRLDDLKSAVDAALPKAGGTLTGSATLASSFAGGEDEGQPGQFDSTSRLNLESYQRANVGSYGETIRHYLMRKDAKAMEAWYFPSGGYDANRNPVGAMKPVVWAGAHWEANNHASNHKHWSVETPDATGAIQTRFEVRFGNPTVDNAIAGLNKTMIATNLADFVVRCTNGQELRLSAPVGQEKGLTFSHDADGADQYRRWRIRVTSDAEPGTGSGSNFALSRYDDAGTFVDSPIYVTRSNGRVGFGVTDPAVRLDIGDDRIRLRQSRTPATATSFGNQGDICWDANFVYVCVAASSWKRAPLAAW